MTTVKNIYDYLNSIAPFETQEEWDNSGFLAGDFRGEVRTVVLALDASKEVAAFAKSVNAELLITHHPLIFNPVSSVEKGTALYELVSSGVSVISTHTCYDRAKGGINDSLAELLELDNIRQVPDSFLSVGELQGAMSIDDFADYVSEKLSSDKVLYLKSDKLIKSVAVGGGACGEYAQLAMDNADCFLTGEMKYHELLDAYEKGITVITAGHFETEHIPFTRLADKLSQLFTDLEIIVAPERNAIIGL